ncbi:MAG: hypothetical protein ACP5GD_01780 [Candidatus Micrarchaeia archaeon]
MEEGQKESSEERERLVIWSIIKYINDKNKTPATLSEIQKLCWVAFGGKDSIATGQRLRKLIEELCQKGYAAQIDNNAYNPAYVALASAELENKSVIRNTILLLEEFSAHRK